MLKVEMSNKNDVVTQATLLTNVPYSMSNSATVLKYFDFFCFLFPHPNYFLALRRIGDTKTRLDTIYAKQRQFKTSTSVIEHERRLKHLATKMTVIEWF